MSDFFCRARLSEHSIDRLHRMVANDAPAESEYSYTPSAPSYFQRFLSAHRVAAQVRQRHPRMQVRRLVPILWTAE